MLSLLKKKSDAADFRQTAPWHANFRNVEKLPDIKVVRTAFFVNAAAISVALALLIYFASQEWHLHTLRGHISEWQSQIDRDRKASADAVAMFKKFQAEEAKINEVEAFIKSKPLVSELVTRLAETLPPNIALDTMDLRETGLTLRFSVRGAPDAASGHATAYLEMLKADAVFSKGFDEFTFTSTPTRNPNTGRMAVEFFLRLKGAKK
ncbi:MAG: hypothetical protein RIQ93_2252 [Verrucomicrobiota bacterium]|jgi:hypothetical protein